MPKEILLSSGQKTVVDDEDYEWLNRWRWKAIKSGSSGALYVARNIRDPNDKKRYKTLLMHRLITNVPDGMQVDHINDDTLDNRRSNLRICTASQNQANRANVGGGKHSRYRGVTKWEHGGHRYWQVRIKKDRRTHSVGYFKDEEEAALAYDAKAKEFFGEYARLNFPDD